MLRFRGESAQSIDFAVQALDLAAMARGLCIELVFQFDHVGHAPLDREPFGDRR